MDTINIRYGESLTMAVNTDDTSATQAVLYVGLPGEVPVLVVTAPLTEGVGSFVLSSSDTMIPLGTYRYQINIEHSDGTVEKYPLADDCPEDGLPEFIVHEALDLQEVS